ncbi:MAG TPA: alpha/beta hydrolase [Anaerolineales bacterium]|jgi:pimeloyl-ACP methyl ester carboxylesterase
MEKIKVNNITLAYERRGKGTPLVLLHGYPLDHHIWNEVAPLLEDAFDLILPDLRGSGESTTVDTPYTMDGMASDVAGLLNHLGIEKTAIAGHSMGGYVALTFARLYPARVLALGLVSTQLGADPQDRKDGRYATAAQVAEKGTTGVVETMTGKLSADARVQGIARTIMEAQSSAGVIGALKAMAERPDSADVISHAAFPVVILHGDADALIPVDRAREVKGLLPGAELIELPGAGHLPMLEAPAATAAALRKMSK